MEDDLPVYSESSWLKILIAVLKDYSFRPVFLWRLAKNFKKGKTSIFANMIWRHIRRVYCIEISLESTIGGGFRLPHPMGIIIGSGVTIGKFVTIGQHVTIGGNFTKINKQGLRYPHIGDYTWVSAGSVVVGPIQIGNAVVIGANSVVTKSVEERSVVSGTPAKLIRYKDRIMVGLNN